MKIRLNINAYKSTTFIRTQLTRRDKNYEMIFQWKILLEIDLSGGNFHDKLLTNNARHITTKTPETKSHKHYVLNILISYYEFFINSYYRKETIVI